MAKTISKQTYIRQTQNAVTGKSKSFVQQLKTKL